MVTAPIAPRPRPVRLAAARHSPHEGDAQLVGMARAQVPLRRVLAGLAARLVAIRGWERLGFARLRDYAVERLGLSPRQAQELASTGRRLAELPALEAELVAGRLSWTKARLVARAATPEDEGRWIALARRSTARALAREVRTVDRGALEAGAGAPEPEDAEERSCLQLRCTPEVHAQWWRVRRVAPRVAGERLPPDACLEAVTAEALSAVGLDADAAARVDADPGPAPKARASQEEEVGLGEVASRPGAAVADAAPAFEPPAANPRPALPGDLQALLDGLEEADAFELDARLRWAVALEQRALARIGDALLEAFEAGLHRDAGFRTLDDYARERLAIAPRRARSLLRIARAARRLPGLAAAWRAGRLSWVRAQSILPVLMLPEARGHEARWVLHAGAVTVRRLDEDVGRALALRESRPDRFSETGGLPEGEEGEREDGLPADRQTGARPKGGDGDPLAPGGGAEAASASGSRRAETARLLLFGPRDVVRLLRATLCTVRRRLERETGRPATEGEAFGAVLSHALATWEALEGRGRRASHRVFERDGWRCTMPGCSGYRNLHDHHVVFRSAGGSDALSNRTTLCAWHHLRGVHLGLVGVRGRAPDGLRFALGLRPDGPPLARYGPGERLETPC